MSDEVGGGRIPHVQEVLDVLTNSGVFHGLRGHRAELLQLLTLATRETVKPGTMLTEQGNPSEKVFVLLSGEARVVADGVSIDGIVLAKGGIIGEICFLTSRPYLATVIATTAAEVLIISYAALQKIMDGNQKFCLEIFRCFTLEILRKLAAVTDQVVLEVQGDVVTKAAHDLRAPIAALKSFAVTLHSISNDERSMIDKIATRVQDIASHLLKKDSNSPSRKAENSRYLKPIPFTSIVELLAGLVAEKIALYGAVIEFDSSASEVGSPVKIDGSELIRILSNLVDNSVEAIPAKGGWVKITVTQSDEFTSFIVKDNGVGIPADILPHLGKYRLSFIKENGNGLALLSARKQVETWGGQITIDSKPQQGTAVTISIPNGG